MNTEREKMLAGELYDALDYGSNIELGRDIPEGVFAAGNPCRVVHGG